MGSDEEPGDALSQLTRLFAERAAATGAVMVPEQPDAASAVAPAMPSAPAAPVAAAPVTPSFSASASPSFGGPAPAPAFGGAPIAAHREHVLEQPPAAPPVSAATALSAPSVLPQPEPAMPVSAAAVLSAPPASASPPAARPLPGTVPAYSPPAPAPSPSAPAPSGSPGPSSSPGAAPAAAVPFAARGPLLPLTGPVDEVDEDELARPRAGERIALILAILLPPVGLIVAIVAAARSASRRGWVIGLVRAAVAVGIVMSVVAAGGAYAGYKVIRQQQAHDQTVAASAPFCAALKKDPTLTAVDGGWPQPAASVPESVTAMQAFVDRWNALAKIAPTGVRQGVAGVAGAGTDVIGSVQVSHTVDDAQNRQSLRSAVAASGIADWRAEYCG